MVTREQHNCSGAERVCYAVVCTVLTLCGYLKQSQFTVRTDHNAIRSILTLNVPMWRLT